MTNLPVTYYEDNKHYTLTKYSVLHIRVEIRVTKLWLRRPKEEIVVCGGSLDDVKYYNNLLGDKTRFKTLIETLQLTYRNMMGHDAEYYRQIKRLEQHYETRYL